MLNQVGHFDLPDGFSLFDICARHHVHIHRVCGRNFGTRMLARVILAITAAAFISALSDSTDAWARGGKGGHGRGMKSGWSGKSMHGMHGKSGHSRHFPGQMHHANRKHDSGHHAQGQGAWHKASGKSSDFRRDWQAGGSGVGSYGGGATVSATSA